MNEKTKTIVTIIFLLFAYPFGLFLTWFWVSWPKWVKWLATSPILLAILGVILMLVLATINPKKQIQEARKQQVETVNKYGNSDLDQDKLIVIHTGSVQSALELYKVDNLRYPDRLEELYPKYISPLPVNPATGASYEYKVNPDGTYILTAILSNGTTKYTRKSP